MPTHRLLTEFGLGTSLRRRDYTGAADRAIRDALWHNSINLAELFGAHKEAMKITVRIGVQDPDAVDTGALAGIFPYGQVSFEVTHGGLDVPKPGGMAVIANVAISVALDLEPVT